MIKHRKNDIHRKRPQLPKILWLVIVILVLLLDSNNNHHHHYKNYFVQAKCVVQNREGKSVSLTSLPKGVEYNSATDALVCRLQNSCREWTITSCNMVHCSQGHACQNSTFVDNQSTMCYFYAACQEAKFVRSKNVNCGMQAINSCLQSHIEASGTVMCVGPHACVSDDDVPMHVSVGASGYVKCLKGEHAYSCKNMVVHVNHARRACIVASEATRGHCAVVCEGKDECLASTIAFNVSPV
ncbi:hypothetical protein ACA910_011187 [Epithemia clementina (nom. ined.)]